MKRLGIFNSWLLYREIILKSDKAFLSYLEETFEQLLTFYR